MAQTQRLPRPVETLLALAAELHREGGDRVRRLGRDLLSPSAAADCAGGGVSELNGDGTPLQLCLSASARGVATRLVADPAWEIGDAASRLTASLAAVRAALAASDAAGLAPLVDHAAKILAPREHLHRFTRGTLWFAGAGDVPGGAVYFDAQALGDAAWTLARQWLGELLPHARHAQAALDAIAPHTVLASLGIEGTAAFDARAKIYFRLRQPVPLAALGVPLLDAPALTTLLTEVVASHSMRLSGTVFGLGFAVASGAPVDSKLDLCGHCLPYSAGQWCDLLARIAPEFGVAPYGDAVREALLAGRAHVAFIGVGTDDAGRNRMNLYLRGGEEAPVIAGNRSTPREAIARAVDYLASIQEPDGSWIDYRLPVGRSTEWVTAFAGLALAEVSRLEERAGAAAGRAAAWLRARRAYSAGWGYNGNTGPDADSTGFALRLLNAIGAPRDARDEAWLLGKWKPSGGFATFDGPEAWGHAHPCVTAAAFLALPDEERAARRATLLRYANGCRRPDGTWPAYWWRTHHYSTWHHLRLLAELGVDAGEVASEEPDEEASAFELAYHAGIEHRAGRPSRRDRITALLLERQQPGGAFPGAANLRVTDPECATPWLDPRGTLYRDERGTITTASALVTLLEIVQ